MRRPPMAIGPIGAIKPAEIQLLDRIDHEMRQMPIRQPIPQIGRQQQHLITITRNEVLSHPERVLTPPDRPIYATAS